MPDSQVDPYKPPQAVVGESSQESQLASRWQRLGGALIDGVIMMVVLFPLLMLLGLASLSAAVEPSFTHQLVSTAIGLAVFTAIQGFTLHTRGQTIGKIALGTRIVAADTQQLVPIGKLLGLRYLPLYLVSAIPLIGSVAGLINILFIFRTDHRCVHDLIAGTVVVRVES